MGTGTGRIHRYRLYIIVSFGIRLRTAAIIDALRPVHFDERKSRNELFRGPIDRVKESIFEACATTLRMRSIDAQVDQHELLDIVEIPVVVLHRLKMPLEHPSCEIHGKN